ncbi:O-antigen ligase family protein [Quadrisphaera sp. DSM 44207]|uniref:O-antigen ligase family protein n=1 Tax=Quadrisphaera sp. DSM 44207 TaxID=1881057 RepID=UPI00088B9551|nr:O-antigen ligase family protein [Quadrisphaera sp. DSM 44207]SDQ68285.1 O-antigen ligase [Quadrisphaera sp. DSM 44207]
MSIGGVGDRVLLPRRAPRRAPAHPGPAADRAAGRGTAAPRAGSRRPLLALVLATWALVVVPRLLQTLTAPKFRVSVGEEGAAPTALAAASQLALLGAVAAVCLWVLLTRLPRARADRWGSLAAALGLWGFLVFRDLYAGHVPDRASVLFPLLVLAVWVLRPALRDLAVLAWLTGLTAAVSTAVALVAPEQGLFRSVRGEFIQPDKQLLPGGVLVGVFTQGNNLGQFLVLGLPAVVLVARRRWRLLLVVLVAAALVWSASRSSLAAFAAAAATLLALALSGRSPALRACVSSGALAVATALTLLLPFLTRDDAAFSNRGYIWRLSLAAWREHLLVGHGPDHYAAVARFANPLVGTAFHGHNQVVQVLVTGGLVHLCLTGLLLVLLCRRAVASARAGSAWPTLALVSLLVSCSLEVSFGVVDRDFLLPVTVLPLAVLLFADVPRPGRPALGGAS